MATYIYCSDDGYDTSIRPLRAKNLTPRGLFYADGRRDARATFTRIESLLHPDGREFGAAGFRRETKREHAKNPCLCETLPDIFDVLRDAGYREV